jgi:hypothetical protein
VRPELFRADGRTDGHDETNSRFSQFGNALKNSINCTISLILQCSLRSTAATRNVAVLYYSLSRNYIHSFTVLFSPNLQRSELKPKLYMREPRQRVCYEREFSPKYQSAISKTCKLTECGKSKTERERERERERESDVRKMWIKAWDREEDGWGK